MTMMLLRGWNANMMTGVILVSVLLHTSELLFASSLLTPRRSLTTVNEARANSLLHCMRNDQIDDDDDDGDELTIKPYRNRSLAWTLRYRKLNPYETARARVINFGHRSKDDWDDAMASGQLGQYVPSYPNEMYALEWISWEEWLGLMRSYNDTKNLATNILGLKSLDDYLLFVKSNSKRARGLRIPVRPDIFYKNEWVDEETFFRK